MKQAAFFLFAVAIAWAIFFRPSTDVKPIARVDVSAASASVDIAQPVSVAPPSTHPQVEVAVLPVAPSEDASHRPQAPPNTLPFRLHGEYVVSHGDLLLGKPTRGDFPQEGFVPLPKFQDWDGREIAYSLHQDLTDTDRVLKVIEYFNENTPVRFVPLKDQKDSIVFAPSTVPLCLSYVGKVGGHQPIFLDHRCGEREITHEILHALGFVHEHSRPDRDQYVRVNWQNIEADKQGQYEIVPDAMALPYRDRPFDFNSATIYNGTDFGRMRGDITLEGLSGEKIEPVAFGISPEDLARLHIKYGQKSAK